MGAAACPEIARVPGGSLSPVCLAPKLCPRNSGQGHPKAPICGFRGFKLWEDAHLPIVGLQRPSSEATIVSDSERILAWRHSGSLTSGF